MTIKRNYPRRDFRQFLPLDEMYWCEECCELVNAEQHYDDDTGYREIRCTQCRSEEVVEPKKCPVCGGLISPYEDNGVEDLCETCVENLDHSISKAIEIFRQGTNISYKKAKELILERMEQDDEI